MTTRLAYIGLFWIIAILIVSVFSTTVTGSRVAVDYSKTITDLQGDVDTVDAEDYEDDGDIILLKTSENSGTITIELTVLGTIHTAVKGDEDSARYDFFMDINPPAAEGEKRIADWMITIYNTINQKMMFMIDDNSEHEYQLTAEDVTGDGTNTLIVKFPLEYITDDILGWDIKADTDISIHSESTSTFTSAEDDTGGSWSWTMGGGGDGDGGDGTGEDEDGTGNPWDTPDPSTETPTDTSIKVAITESTWTYTNDSGYISMDITVKGITSGVDHCEILDIEFFNDGTKETDFDWNERFVFDNMEYGDTKVTSYHFKETSPDWKTWEYTMKGSMKLEMDASEYEKYPVSVEVYVRAFNDEDELKWNQASKTSKVTIIGLYGVPDGSSDDGDGGSDDDAGLLPGFEAILVISSICMVLMISRIYRWKRVE